MKTRAKRNAAAADLDARQELRESIGPPAEPAPSPEEFADNPEERQACLILLDRSASMDGEPISQVNAGLKAFRDAVADHARLRRQLDLSIIPYDSKPAVAPFVNFADWEPPVLAAGSGTWTATALHAALDQLELRVREYNDNGISFHTPWMFLFTDGQRTDGIREYQAAAERIQKAEVEKRLNFFPVGVLTADLKGSLAQLSKVNRPLRLADLEFVLFFRWLAGSLKQKSMSATTETIDLANPVKTADNPKGWAVAN
jgi:uncharacterized protein YegL